MANQSTTFSPKVQQQLQSYVYIYIDPRDGEIFYIGQGKNNRVFDHGNDVRDETRKVKVLKQLTNLTVS